MIAPTGVSARSIHSSRAARDFFYRYIARVPEERISPSLIFGSAVHEALKEMFLQRQKLEAEGRSRAEVDWDAVQAVFTGTLERAFEGPLPVEGREEDSLASLRAKGLAMIEKIFPDLVPEKSSRFRKPSWSRS